MNNFWNENEYAIENGGVFFREDDGQPEEAESREAAEHPEKPEGQEASREPEASELPEESSGRDDAGEASEQEGDEESSGQDGLEDDNSEDERIIALLDKRILRAVQEMGFEKFTPIQVQAIPYLLQGEDIIGQAQTGTGKTAAFGIPIIQQVDAESKKLQAIILCPTRELAVQASEELRRLARYMPGIKVLPVYGGQEITKQFAGLKGTQIVVGTPGRVMDHMRRHTIKLDDISMVVLDEADEMLNMGFLEDMEEILGQIPNEHQTALFSATMPKPILGITNRFQKDAKMIKIAAKELTIPLVSQRYYRVRREDKDAACIRLLEYYQPRLTLIFCNTKRKVDELSEVLKQRGYQAEGLHGDMSQHQRDVAMGRFRKGSTSILIATDVAARGIDVDDVEIVINYDIPQDIEYYVHRIGRTGRAGKTGRSFTFVSGREIYQLRDIERVCNTTVEEKKLPGAGKVLKVRAEKYLDRAWELHEHEDLELMKNFLEQKLEEIGGDAMDMAAAMLKLYVGDRSEDIATDDYVSRKSRSGRRESGRGSRGGRGGLFEGFGRRRERGGRDDFEDFGRRKERGTRDDFEDFGRREKRSGRDDFEDFDRKKERSARDDFEDFGRKKERGARDDFEDFGRKKERGARDDFEDFGRKEKRSVWDEFENFGRKKEKERSTRDDFEDFGRRRERGGRDDFEDFGRKEKRSVWDEFENFGRKKERGARDSFEGFGRREGRSAKKDGFGRGEERKKPKSRRKGY